MVRVGELIAQVPRECDRPGVIDVSELIEYGSWFRERKKKTVASVVNHDELVAKSSKEIILSRNEEARSVVHSSHGENTFGQSPGLPLPPLLLLLLVSTFSRSPSSNIATAILVPRQCLSLTKGSCGFRHLFLLGEILDSLNSSAREYYEERSVVVDDVNSVN